MQFPIARRRFLQRSGTLGLAALGGGCSAVSLDEGAVSQKHDRVDQVTRDMEAGGEKFLTMAPPEARFLHLLAQLARARRILEIGTAEGYATLWLARAAATNRGRIETIEIVPERVQKARAHLVAAGLAKQVAFHEGDAHDIVTRLKGPFDFILLDADKSGNLDYFHKLVPGKVVAGALILAHNAISSEDSMKPYRDHVESLPGAEALPVNIVKEEGFLLTQWQG